MHDIVTAPLALCNMHDVTAPLALCSLSSGIDEAKSHGAKYRLGPELEIW